MRDVRLDFYKGFLIWSVVLGHCLNICCPREITLHLLLRTFDLPMFMYISGFLLKGSLRRCEWKQLIWNKVTGILVPAIVWAIVSLFLGDRCLYYFLWAVFLSVFLVCVTEQLLGRSWAWVGMIFIVVGLHLIPCRLVNLSFLFPFFLIGYYSKDITGVGWSKGIVALILFITLFIFFWRPQYTIWNSGGCILWRTGYMVQVIALRLVIGLAGIYSAVMIWSKLYYVIMDNPFTSLMANIGQKTLGIYLLQHVIVEILLLRVIIALNIWDIQNAHQVLIGYLLTPVLSLMLLIGMYKIVCMIKQYRFSKWMLGFKHTF